MMIKSINFDIDNELRISSNNLRSDAKGIEDIRDFMIDNLCGALADMEYLMKSVRFTGDVKLINEHLTGVWYD